MFGSGRKSAESNSDKQNNQKNTSIYSLPYDVLIIIFSTFDLRTLGALLLTNKYFSWFLTSQAANLIWEQQIANHFPMRYQGFKKENQLSKTTHQVFKEYYKSDEAYKDLTREEKLVFSYLKDENISALEKYNSASNSASKNTHIRVDQIPFHFLEWVAEYASQDFKNHLYEHVYKEVIESDQISNYFKFFPKIASKFFWTDKARVESDILIQYNQDVSQAYFIVRVITSLFLGQSLKPILESSVLELGDPFDIVRRQESRYCNRKFWSEYVDKRCWSYFTDSSSYLGRYCLVSDIENLNKMMRGTTLQDFPVAIVRRGNEEALKALNSYELSSAAFRFALGRNNARVLNILLDGDRNERIKSNWVGLLDLFYIFSYITPECFQILGQHLEDFFELDSKKQTQDQLKKLSEFFEVAMISDNIRMTAFFLEKYPARFYADLEQSKIHEFCMSKNVIWRCSRSQGQNKILTLELMEIRDSLGETLFFPPKVKFEALEKDSQSLPKPMVNFFMVCALSEWYQYQWFENGSKNPKLGALQELIWHVIQNQERDFGDLVKEWKGMTNATMQGKTNLEIIRLQGALASEAKDIAVNQLLLPAIGLFSHSAKEWVANQPKTATEKFIQELIDGAALYAKPRVEEVLKNDSDPEKSSTKKM